MENDYLNQVVQQQANVDRELRRKVGTIPAPASPAQAAPMTRSRGPGGPPGTDTAAFPPVPPDGGAAGARGIEYRITGFWRWQTVVVPPNVYVVHTRRGHDEPIHFGLGTSFSFDPATDAFLLIPAATQTILINARCICAERQGILVQAYVQWEIDDIKVAYRKLDFSDAEDPMRIVNVQLREQAEAAIKDKVAGMGIDEVLSDKQPIITELTNRLRAVAEGSGDEGKSGLGLKIVTVQIKEAVVSSARLWENLQAPFRAQRERLARMAALETEQQIAAREMESRLARETAELETERRLADLRAQREREVYDREQAEKARRLKLEQEAELAALTLRNAAEAARKEAELAMAMKEMELEGRRIAAAVEALRARAQLDAAEADRAKSKAENEINLEDRRHAATAARTEKDYELRKVWRKIENNLTEEFVRSQLVSRLPEIAKALPKPDELRNITVSGAGGDGSAASLTGLLAGLLAVLRDGHGKAPPPEPPAVKSS